MYYFSLIQDLGQFCPSFDGTVQTWARKSNLDYLSLDFNSASPSPVQKVCLYSLSILCFLCLCIQEGRELCSFIVLQNSSLRKSRIQIMRLIVSLHVFLFTQKPFLSDEHRVDYVQVDEKKTQALQNTKMEWTDVRQSKT